MDGYPQATARPTAWRHRSTWTPTRDAGSPQTRRRGRRRGSRRSIARPKQPDQYRPPTQQDPWRPEPPRAGQRVNPLTGQPEPRTFPKSYGCDGGFDYGYLYTVRSGTAAFYDKRLESGTIHISGPRSGCTNSIVPACGLLNVPYYYKGCTCSYPLPTSAGPGQHAADVRAVERWGQASQEPVRAIQRVGINFGAPGDRMTAAGTLWLDASQRRRTVAAGGLAVEPESPAYFYHHSLFVRGGRGWPWVAASGVEGLTRTAGRPEAGALRRALYFAEPSDWRPAAECSTCPCKAYRFCETSTSSKLPGAMRAVVGEANDVLSEGSLEIRTTSRVGKPLLGGLEVVAQGLPLDELPRLPDR